MAEETEMTGVGVRRVHTLTGKQLMSSLDKQDANNSEQPLSLQASSSASVLSHTQQAYHHFALSDLSPGATDTAPHLPPGDEDIEDDSVSSATRSFKSHLCTALVLTPPIVVFMLSVVDNQALCSHRDHRDAACVVHSLSTAAVFCLLLGYVVILRPTSPTLLCALQTALRSAVVAAGRTVSTRSTRLHVAGMCVSGGTHRQNRCGSLLVGLFSTPANLPNPVRWNTTGTTASSFACLTSMSCLEDQKTVTSFRPPVDLLQASPNATSHLG